MSPLEIKMLLHFHCMADPYPWNGSPAESDAMRGFREKGLVVDPGVLDVDAVKLSERGRAYVHFLTTLPLPNATWSVPGYEGCTLPSGMVP